MAQPTGADTGCLPTSLALGTPGSRPHRARLFLHRLSRPLPALRRLPPGDTESRPSGVRRAPSSPALRLPQDAVCE